MRVLKIVTLIAIIAQLTLAAQEQQFKLNDVATSSERDVIQRFDPRLKKALVKALTRLEKNETISDLVDSSEDTEENVSPKNDLFSGKSSTVSSVKDDDEVIIKFGNIDPVKSSDVGVQSLSIQSRSSGSTTAIGSNSFLGNSLSVAPRKTVKKATTTTTTTTTTPRPTHNEDGQNIEEVRKQDVKIAPAPLVAAFTVHQDASGSPKAIHPIFQKPANGQIEPSQQQPQQQLGFGFQRNGQPLNPIEQEALLQQQYIALQQREELLRQQFLREQDYLRRQQIFLQDQYRIHQDAIRFRLISQQQQQQQFPFFQQGLPFIPFQNFQQPAPTVATAVPPQTPAQAPVPTPAQTTQQTNAPTPAQTVAPINQVPQQNPPISPLPTNQQLPVKEANIFNKSPQIQVQQSIEPFRQQNAQLPAHQFPLLAPNQQLPLRNAQPFHRHPLPPLPPLPQQPFNNNVQPGLPQQPFNNNNAQPNGQQTPFNNNNVQPQQPFSNNIQHGPPVPQALPSPGPTAPTSVQALPNHNRVFRHEQGVGNFGVNNQFQQQLPQFRQQYNPYVDAQIHNLLLKNGISRPQDEDSYVIAKVLALNHGQQDNFIDQHRYRNIF